MATKHKAAAKRKGKKKGGSPVHYMSTKRPKGYKPLKRKTAAKIVDSDLRVLLKGLRNDERKVKRERDFQSGKAEDLYTRGKGDLEFIRAEVEDATNAQNSKIDQSYTETGTKLQALQAALQGELGQNSQANKAAALAEQARLGIQQSGTGNFDADAANQQAVAAQTGSNEQANLGLAKGMSADIGQMLLGMNQGSFLSNMGRILNTKNDSQAQLSHTSNEQLMDIMDQMGETRAGRGGAISKLYGEMDDRRFNRWSTQKEMGFNQQLAANEFNLNLQQTRKENALRAAAARRAKSYGGGGGGGGSSGFSSGASAGASSGSGGSRRRGPLQGALTYGAMFGAGMGKAYGGKPKKPKKPKKLKTRYTSTGKHADWFRS